MPIAFQPNAFQDGYIGPNAFQTSIPYIQTTQIDVLPLLDIDIMVNEKRNIPNLAPGALIITKVYIRDNMSMPSALTDVTTITMTVLNPDRDVYINNQPLTKLDTGIYGYIQDTDIIPTQGFQANAFQPNAFQVVPVVAGIRGIYVGWFNIEFEKDFITIPKGLFKLV